MEDELGYSFFKILDKKCSIKRLTKFDIIDKRLIFEKCNLLVNKDVIIFQGIQVNIFDRIVQNFIITNNPEKLTSEFSSWQTIKPISIEYGENKSEIKYIF